MILRDMPAIWDAAFRPRFYARWGKENFVISARARRVDYPDFEQSLSIKAAFDGNEDYFIDGRRVSVDDDTYLILNERRTYSSSIHVARPMHSFSIFFRPRMAAEILASLTRSTDYMLECPDGPPPAPVEFSEHLRAHDRRITPVLKFIYASVQQGLDDELWLEEQLALLLERMFGVHLAERAAIDHVPASRSRTRRELFRRAALGWDLIHTSFRDPLDLRAIAAAGHLSPYHFLRVFRAVYGETPSACLRRKRCLAAGRLLRGSDLSISDVASEVGFQSRTTLLRQARKHLGGSPQLLRARCSD